MIRDAAVAVLVGGFMLVHAGCGPQRARFGEPMTLGERDTMPVARVLPDAAAYDGKYVRVGGKVTDVCAMKGCWLRLGDDTTPDTVFVKFHCPIEGRLIPMEAVGHVAVVEGKVTIEEISEEDARHYAEESGQPAAEVAKINGPQRHVRIASPAAEIEGIKTSS